MQNILQNITSVYIRDFSAHGEACKPESGDAETILTVIGDFCSTSCYRVTSKTHFAGLLISYEVSNDVFGELQANNLAVNPRTLWDDVSGAFQAFKLECGSYAVGFPRGPPAAHVAHSVPRGITN